MTFYEAILNVGTRTGIASGRENLSWAISYLELPQVEAEHLPECDACARNHPGTLFHTIALARKVYEDLTSNMEFKWDGLSPNSEEVPDWQLGAEIYLSEV
jgi:hypothetical protein